MINIAWLIAAILCFFVGMTLRDLVAQHRAAKHCGEIKDKIVSEKGMIDVKLPNDDPNYSSISYYPKDQPNNGDNFIFLIYKRLHHSKKRTERDYS